MGRGLALVLMLMPVVAFADDTAARRANALGLYLNSYGSLAGLTATECKELRKRAPKPIEALLEDERSFLSESEYRDVKAYVTSDEYKSGIGDIVSTLKGGVAAAMKDGTDHGAACGLVVGAAAAQVKQQKDVWDAVKHRR